MIKPISSLALLFVLLAPAPLLLASEAMQCLHADTDVSNRESLQRGARNFMNYCSGCHSLKYLRYNRLAEDTGIPEKELSANLIFNDSKPFEQINGAMPADAEQWFGKQPPDLSLTARAKGADCIYSLLKGFYQEQGRPWGVNNRYFDKTAMPHVLQSLQGLQEPVLLNETDEHGNAKVVIKDLKLASEGSMKPEEYDQFARDIANFLDYAAEPIKAKRQALGVWVTLFLLAFFWFAYLLKKEYWKDVH
jgi:ubiquinol-cytochrome c reductase cytochrome c1 subunit